MFTVYESRLEITRVDVSKVKVKENFKRFMESSFRYLKLFTIENSSHIRPVIYVKITNN